MVMDNNWITVVSILQDTQMSNYYIVHLKLSKLCQFYISTKKNKKKQKTIGHEKAKQCKDKHHPLHICPAATVLNISIKASPIDHQISNGSVGKESSCNAGDTGDVSSIPGSGRSPREGKWQPLQYSFFN